MATKSQSDTSTTTTDALSGMKALQKSGFGNMMAMGAAWAEAVSDMNAEFVGFVAERIKEDVKTQHQILHCKDIGELRHIQSEFFQKAIDQYHAETGKLVEMSSTVFSEVLEGSRKS